MPILIAYGVVLCLLTLYSYVLVDPNFTLVSHPFWSAFREVVVQIGYYQRPMSWIMYCILIVALFSFHIWFLKKKTMHAKPLLIGLVVAACLFLSYPFLSHDFFNYMFDAKILTFYGDNPYLMRALDYPDDPWLRFMHWTHRTYPYGPFFLVITLVPAFLSFGSFLLHFLLLKGVVLLCYLGSVYFLSKIKKEYAVFFATNPFLLVEGVVMGHNELMAVFLALAGVYYMCHHHVWVGRILIVLSIGIKYMTLPFILLTKKNGWKQQLIALAGVTVLIGYLVFFRDLQQWYFLNLFIFLPLIPGLVERMQILFLGLLISYYPYIRLGGWGESSHVEQKKVIIFTFLVVNLIYLAYRYYQERSSLKGVVLSSTERT